MKYGTMINLKGKYQKQTLAGNLPAIFYRAALENEKRRNKHENKYV